MPHIPLTVLAVRIRAAESPRAITDMMKYDLPQDPIVRALCDRLIVSMENECPERCPKCGEAL
jgi:hypothetical protein